MALKCTIQVSVNHPISQSAPLSVAADPASPSPKASKLSMFSSEGLVFYPIISKAFKTMVQNQVVGDVACSQQGRF